MPHTVDRELYLTADRTEVVGPNDRRAAFLFAIPGDEVSDADAERYGLTNATPPEPEADEPEEAPAEGPEPEEKAEEKADDTPANKAVEAPPNKARRTRKRT